MEFELKNGQKVIFHGRNKNNMSTDDWNAEIEPEVNVLYNALTPDKRGRGHGNCAEMMALSAFLRAGHNLSDIKGIKNFATGVEGPNSANHGNAWQACRSCQNALEQFDLIDVGAAVKDAGVLRRSELP